MFALFAMHSQSMAQGHLVPFGLMESEETKLADARVTVSQVPHSFDRGNFNADQNERDETIRALIKALWQKDCRLRSVASLENMPRHLDGRMVQCHSGTKHDAFLFIFPAASNGAAALFRTRQMRVLKCFEKPKGVAAGVWPCNSLGRPV
jgi:hypothetical protein